VIDILQDVSREWEEAPEAITQPKSTLTIIVQ
jgi:hypothetical protein